MFKNILVPLDGSRFGSHALRYAFDLAHHYNARVVLLRVVEPEIPVSAVATPMGMETSTSAQIAVEEATRQDQINARHAKRYMHRKLREVTSRGIQAAYHVIIGDPFDSIMNTCKKEHIDLVVMTTHGKSGLKRAILGSVADKVVRDTRVPALVIRPRQRKRK
jgi:nucleotide-binding universal stress UspA family protein